MIFKWRWGLKMLIYYDVFFLQGILRWVMNGYRVRSCWLFTHVTRYISNKPWGNPGETYSASTINQWKMGGTC